MIRRVIDRIRKLPLAVKITVAGAVAVVCGYVGYRVLGPAGIGLSGLGPILAGWFGVKADSPTLADTAAELAARDTKRAEEDALEAVEAAELVANERIAAEELAARDRALAAGELDDGDPRRVYWRHSEGAGADSGGDG